MSHCSWLCLYMCVCVCLCLCVTLFGWEGTLRVGWHPRCSWEGLGGVLLERKPLRPPGRRQTNRSLLPSFSAVVHPSFVRYHSLSLSLSLSLSISPSLHLSSPARHEHKRSSAQCSHHANPTINKLCIILTYFNSTSLCVKDKLLDII